VTPRSTTPNSSDGTRSYTRKDWTDFVHTGPGTLAGRYLRRFWQPAFRSEDLQPGQAKPVKLMSEDFTLYRGESGQVYALAFRCAHRGTQLSTGWVEGETLRCRYHGWVYDGQGQCVEQPAEPRPFCERVQIRSYPVYDYLGLIFVYLGEGEPPPPPYYPDFEVEGVRRVNLHPRRCNFFSNLENSCDEYHVCFTHKGAFGEYMETLPEKIWGGETDYGIAATVGGPAGRRASSTFRCRTCSSGVGRRAGPAVAGVVPSPGACRSTTKATSSRASP
jgi:5,5'-dehydrodivanillate O-demethylase